jgi:DNA-binding NtrC family response regulator
MPSRARSSSPRAGWSRRSTSASFAGQARDAAIFLTIAAREKRVIGEALQRTHGHKARAAPLLGLTGFQLYACLKRY